MRYYDLRPSLFGSLVFPSVFTLSQGPIQDPTFSHHAPGALLLCDNLSEIPDF